MKDYAADPAKPPSGYFLESIRPALEQLNGVENVNQVIREIQFPPEYQHSGITILSNFGSYIRKKYNEEKIKISIQQEGSKVILVVEGEDGSRERIVEEMETYGLVLRGEKDVTELTEDPYILADIKNQLRIAHLQLENQKDLLEIEKRHSDQLDRKSISTENQYKEVVKILAVSLQENSINSALLQKLLSESVRTNSATASRALDFIYASFKSEDYEKNEQQIKEQMLVLAVEAPNVVDSLKSFCEATAMSIAGSSAYSMLLGIISTLPKP